MDLTHICTLVPVPCQLSILVSAIPLCIPILLGLCQMTCVAVIIFPFLSTVLILNLQTHSTWKLHKADWTGFADMCSEELEEVGSNLFISSILHDIASTTIPKKV